MNLKKFKFLISKDAAKILPEITLKAKQETLKHFGRTVQLYAPLYISNECVNACAYCGFNVRSKIKRTTLKFYEVLEEAQFLKKQGFQHILLLTGESPRAVSVDYLKEIVTELKKHFVSISIEVYPLEEKDYRSLAEAGVDGLTLYQETYHRLTYKRVHLKGPKRDFDFRLQSAERAAKAGIRKIGIGFLLGLYDFRYEAVKLAEHLDSLLKNYWQTQFQASFPRINPAETNFKVEHPVSDDEFIQLLCAFRLAFPEIGFILSTREKREFRDKIFPLGITQMSAGSKTSPGGYAGAKESGKQFEIADPRTPRQVSKALIKAGYEPVWKDWERTFR